MVNRMTEREKQKIIELVHETLHGFFEPFPEGELGARPFTQTEKVLLEVNKAICEKIKEMTTTVEPSCFLDEEESNALMDIILKGIDLDDGPIGGFHDD